MTKITTVKGALKYLLNVSKEEKGYREDLIEVIAEPVIDRLALRGYITNGVTADDANEGNFKRTYRLTDMASEYKLIFLTEPSEEEKNVSRHLYSIGVR